MKYGLSWLASDNNNILNVALSRLSVKVAYTLKITLNTVYVYGAFPERLSVVETDPSPKISYKSHCVDMTVCCKKTTITTHSSSMSHCKASYMDMKFTMAAGFTEK